MVSQAGRQLRAGQSINTTITIQNDGAIPTAYVVEVVGLTPLGIPGAVARVPVPVIQPNMTRDVPLSLQIPPDAMGGSWTLIARVYEAGPGGALGILIDEITQPGALDVEAPLAPPQPPPPQVAPPPPPSAPTAPTAPPPAPDVPTPVQEIVSLAAGRTARLRQADFQRLQELDPTGVIRSSFLSENELRTFIQTGVVSFRGITLTPDQFRELRRLDPFNRQIQGLTGAQILEFIQTGIAPESAEALAERLRVEERTRRLQENLGPIAPPPPPPPPPPPEMPSLPTEEPQAPTGPSQSELQARLEQQQRELEAARANADALRSAAEGRVDSARQTVNTIQNDLAGIAGELDFLNGRISDVAAAIDEYNSLGFFQIIPVWWSERFGLRNPSIGELNALMAQLREEQVPLRQRRSALQQDLAQAQQALSTAQAELRSLS